MVKISNLKTDTENETVTFDVENCHSSLVNAIRRTILTDVETVGFSTENYNDSTIKIVENTSALTNEIILGRIGLLPINFENIKEYDPEKYKFTLNVHNTGTSIIDVTTKDIEITNMVTNKKEDNSKFFPVNRITKDPILLNRLKPSPDGNGEKLVFEGKSIIGMGSEHIRFSPVSCICFINKQDPQKVEKALTDYLEENKDKASVSELKKTFTLEEADFYYYTNENDEPNVFEFTIESCGVLDPMQIFRETVKKLKLRVQNFDSQLNKYLSNQESNIEIKNTDGVMDGTDIYIKNETHTLGYLLQNSIYESSKNKNNDVFVGYINPHPLENIIILKIDNSNINEIKIILNDAIKFINKEIDDITESMDGPKPKKKKPKFMVKTTTKVSEK